MAHLSFSLCRRPEGGSAPENAATEGQRATEPFAIVPSDLGQPRIYAEIDPEIIAKYLTANGWSLIHEEDGKSIGIRWFRHRLAPRWSNRELLTNRTMPFLLSHLRADGAPGTIVGGGTILRVGAKRYREYPKMNRESLVDLEVHENRWVGFIIADVQRFAT